MVTEPWLSRRIGIQVCSNLTKPTAKDHKMTLGILSFEVASAMSKIAHLHKSLTDREVSKLKNEILMSHGVRTLVSSDDTYLLDLALSEKLDDLHCLAAAVSRLGRKCTVHALRGFEHVYADIVGGAIAVAELGFLVKDMEGMVKKMERYVNSTAALYGEMEVLNELEVATRKFQQNQHAESRKAFEQKLAWQRQDVKHLKDASLWNQTFDRVVELLARTVCTLYARICLVFSDSISRREIFTSSISNSLLHSTRSLAKKSGQKDAASVRSSDVYSCNSGLTEGGSLVENKRSVHFKPWIGSQRGDITQFRAEDFNFSCGIGPGRLFMECITMSPVSKLEECDDNESDLFHDDRSSSLVSGYCSVSSCAKRDLLNNNLGYCSRSHVRVPAGGEQRHFHGGKPKGGVRLAAKSRLMASVPPSTVGGSALALHYANVIIVIEKLLRYPHLVGEEARDDLYQMLPTSLRSSLKTSLKSYAKDLAIYDAPLAHDWKDRLDEMLRWLAPLAHNMIRWQSERNFEQQQIVTRTNVLLLQTLYFADRAKTEAALCELLVGLNYICRYEQQQNALLDCASSFDFDDCVEWSLQY